MTQILIKGGRVMDPESGRDEVTDILIEDQEIKRIGSIEPGDNMHTVDATGLLVIPGIIDIHVHLRDMEQADKETIVTGTKAARKGGVTTVFAMPNTKPPLCAEKYIEQYQELIKDARVETHIVGAITKHLEGKELADIDQYSALSIRAISDDGYDVEDEGLLKAAYAKAKENDLLLITHPEMHSIAPDGVMNEGEISQKLGVPGQPHEKEWKAVERGIRIALELGTRAHFTHVSTKQSVELVREAKKQSDLITVDTTPHHLTLTDKRVDEVGSLGKVNPPLRTEEDRQALIEGLKDGTIDLIATDHAPHRAEDKTGDLKASAFGFSQIETCLATCITTLHYNAGLPLMDVIRLMTIEPAKLMNLRQGRIKEGYPADLTLVDLETEKVVDVASFESKGKNSPYIGMKMKGWPIKTIVRGAIY